MKIAVLDWETITMNGDLSPKILDEFGSVSVYPLTPNEKAAEAIADSDVVLCNKVMITQEVLTKCPNIKYIGLFATGYNNIDIKAAAERNIPVCNAGQYSANAVAQQVFAYILDGYNRIREYNLAVSKGKWILSDIFSYFPIATHELAGKTISIVGYGSIGRKVAEIAEAFDMNVIINTRTVPKDCPYRVIDLKTAAAEADILTFHCPLTEKTRHMINADILSLMKPSALLINTSRGAVADEADLAQVLNSGKIAGAYLDVLETEPMSPETPLKTAKNCIITPHTAWAALETRKRCLDIVCENLRSWINGKPQNKVN